MFAVPRDHVEAASLTSAGWTTNCHDDQSRSRYDGRGVGHRAVLHHASGSRRPGDLQPAGAKVFQQYVGQPVVHQGRDSHVHRQVEHSRQPGPRVLTRSGSACSARLEPVPALERLRRNVTVTSVPTSHDHVDHVDHVDGGDDHEHVIDHHDDGAADHVDAPRPSPTTTHARPPRRRPTTTTTTAPTTTTTTTAARRPRRRFRRGRPCSRRTRINWVGSRLLTTGVNVPWMTWPYAAGHGDFGGGATDGVVARKAAIAVGFAKVQASGTHVVRWWTFQQDAWQINRDANGWPTSLNPAIYADFDAAMSPRQPVRPLLRLRPLRCPQPDSRRRGAPIPPSGLNSPQYSGRCSLGTRTTPA